VAPPQPTFFDDLANLCGRAFEGRIVSPPIAADASFAGKRLVMHVRTLVREGNRPGVDNVWAIEVHRKRIFAYELRRPGRFFRVEFDLASPIASPPPPWGARRSSRVKVARPAR
jgi:hypothetical protein